jgi:hypothetical protein
VTASPRVTRKSFLIGIFPALAICLIIVQLTFRANAGLRQLAADFKSANQAKTIEPMLGLYYLEGSDELSITRLKAALQYELGLAIEKIQFEPLSGAPEETIQFTHNGIRYGPTLKPRYRMRVVYKGKDRFTSIYTIGKTDSGSWQFISAKPVPAAAD